MVVGEVGLWICVVHVNVYLEVKFNGILKDIFIKLIFVNILFFLFFIKMFSLINYDFFNTNWLIFWSINWLTNWLMIIIIWVNQPIKCTCHHSTNCSSKSISSTPREQACLPFHLYSGVSSSIINLVGWSFYPNIYNTIYTDFFPPARGVQRRAVE